MDDPIHHGIDGVYRNKTTGEYIVAEAKYNTSKLNTGNQQMSSGWIDKNLENAVGKTTTESIRSQGYTSNLYNIKADGSIRFDVLNDKAKVIPNL